ncbi:unnamed protein product [Paramecium octaurelia]|uniref:Uncharacterized protein n=1 Tax=Paramecium octaurelia TaxID=43137 RepID=A0A8S1WHB3_PAROT|nr:unnamed protein product [Paramecium octaurelia]
MKENNQYDQLWRIKYSMIKLQVEIMIFGIEIQNSSLSAQNYSFKCWDLERGALLLDNLQSNCKGILDTYGFQDKGFFGFSSRIKLAQVDIVLIDICNEFTVKEDKVVKQMINSS